MSDNFEKTYLQTLRKIQLLGAPKDDRTGVGTRSITGINFNIDLSVGFPLLTTKFVNFDCVKSELLWMLRGETNVNTLDCHIWDAWADRDGDLGGIYGRQWRDWFGIDQIGRAEDMIRQYPNSRRNVVCAWNVTSLPDMALPPCHVLFQFVVTERQLSCVVYQRSADMFLGVPFNIASYALLTHLMAHTIGLLPGRLIWMGADCHIYNNHDEQVSLQYSRAPKLAPQLNITAHHDHVWEYTTTDIVLAGYNFSAAIKAPIAV